MRPERLNILSVTPWPPSPPRAGAQARMHGLNVELARRHDLTLVSLIDEGFDAEATSRALREYCHDFHLVRDPGGRSGWARRVAQARSLLSARSFQRLLFSSPELQAKLDQVLAGRSFHVVKVDFPYLAHYDVRQAPPGSPLPAVVVDTHDISYDLLRQVARSRVSPGRRVYAALNWRKLAREERACYRSADGVLVCSAADRARVLADVPTARVAVVPNAADVEFFQPREADPPADGRTVLFFGLLSTFPNIDGVQFLMREIWPRISAARPEARCKVVGARPPDWLSAMAGPRVEVTGLVGDLRPHLASAAVVVVPLRLGSGTRLKIVEAMAMAKAVVSTRLGAEGIEAVPGREIEIADEPGAFASAVVRILDDPDLALRLGRAGRDLAVRRYSWSRAARDLESFFGEIAGPARPAVVG
jgi:polysaccharide biosynthesis protein PslH